MKQVCLFLISLLWTNNSSEHLLFHYSRVMAVSVCSLCRLNLLVPTPAWRLRLVPSPPHFFLTRDALKERAGLLLPTILVVFAAGGVPAQGAGVAVAPDRTGWARTEAASWQEAAGAEDEEGPGVKLHSSRIDLDVLEERTQSSGQSEHPFMVFSFLFVYSASQPFSSSCCWCYSQTLVLLIFSLDITMKGNESVELPGTRRSKWQKGF